MKRMEVQRLQQEMKLGIILIGQVRYYSLSSLVLLSQILLFFGFFAIAYPTNAMCMFICLCLFETWISKNEY